MTAGLRVEEAHEGKLSLSQMLTMPMSQMAPYSLYSALLFTRALCALVKISAI